MFVLDCLSSLKMYTDITILNSHAYCQETVNTRNIYGMLLCSEEKAISQCGKTKPQTAMEISCGFEVCCHDLNFIVISQYTINLSESNQSVHSFLSFTVSFTRY